jgi:multimeric flavodoxin WrbA
VEVYGYLYLIRNRVDGLVYVGQTTSTVERRWKAHQQSINQKKCRHLQLYRAIKKHGAASFDVVELGRAFSESELDEMEVRAIWSHSSTDKFLGYNKHVGGTGGGRGFRHSEDSRNLMRLRQSSRKRMPLSEEHKKALSLAHRASGFTDAQRAAVARRPSRKGIPRPLHVVAQIVATKQAKGLTLDYLRTPETKAKAAAARVGLTRSEEAKKKTAEKHRGMKRSPEARRNMALAQQRRYAEKKQQAELLAHAERTN